jgi:L-lysine exporter family protein LysE/ArgO
VSDVIGDSFSGLVTGLTLIVAIGAQNAFVLRQGLRRAHVGPVVTVCTLSDYALILTGTAGLGAVIRYAPWALLAVRWLGVAFLTCYGLSSAWRARRPSALSATGEPGSGPGRRGATVGRTLALTWLNPHVYLDTVVLLGSMASTHGEHRWQFAAGAGLGSTIWFTGLGYGARLLRPVFARPAAWRVLDGVIAVVMSALAVSLAARGLSGT